MSTRNDILEALKEELKEIQPGNDNYTSSVGEIRRGWADWQAAANTPSLSVNLLSDEVEEVYLGSEDRMMYLVIFCWMENDYENDYDKVHDLLRDVEYFLENDFSHKDNTEQGRVTISEGGISLSNTWFEVAVEIRYSQAL